MLGGECRIGTRLAAGDDAADEGAVALSVVECGSGVGGVGAEVDGSDDLALAGQALDRGDAGVDDGDVDAGAGEALLPERTGTDLVDDVVHRTEWQVGGGDRWLDGRWSWRRGRHEVRLGGVERGKADERQARSRSDRDRRVESARSARSARWRADTCVRALPFAAFEFATCRDLRWCVRRLSSCPRNAPFR